MKRYQVLVNCNICGHEAECLEKVVFGEENAKNITNELIANGKVARYEELPIGQAWFDDANWIG